MARKKREESPAPRNIWPMLRFVTLTLATVTAVFGAGWAAWQVQQTVAADARFRFAPDGQATAEAVELTGVQNASRSAILRVFATDRDQPLSHINLAKRAEEIQQLEWVKSVTVRRVWPNRLAVAVAERKPVAFIQIASGASGSYDHPIAYSPALIDEEGEILRSHIPEKIGLPLLAGVRPRDPRKVRQEGVRRMRGVLGELGGYGTQVEEVDVSDPQTIMVAYNLGDKQVRLILGEEEYRKRLENFLKHYPGIRDQVNPRDTLDLSVDGRVIKR
jgi:cell division protein FtsQ